MCVQMGGGFMCVEERGIYVCRGEGICVCGGEGDLCV